jgi:hypothetical protein
MCELLTLESKDQIAMMIDNHQINEDIVKAVFSKRK